MKKYLVLTGYGFGAPCFESDSKRECNAYLRQALKKGSEPGYLCIVKSRNK